MADNNNDPIAAFEKERVETIASYKGDKDFQASSNKWMDHAFRRRYMYHFDWLGRPIIQLPGDMVAIQEIIWDVKPDLIVETGIAHGGSLILSASVLAMIDVAEAIENGTTLDPKASKRRVLGVDIDIRDHNRAAIEGHPFAQKIDMIQGSSIEEATADKVREYAAGHKKIMVCLDSNHTHEHVMAELELYAPLTSAGSYCLVFDSIVEDLPDDMFPDRPWCKGNNPKTAIWEYLRLLKEDGRKAADGNPLNMEIDEEYDSKLLLTAAPNGYLKRI
ncbi:MAG: cephalosporin hydroxylase family protein [Alphaproteobacteria bacterium]|nr:cephalosporin hydroxylase family protein [Alphaproteobacteria bacterium]